MRVLPRNAQLSKFHSLRHKLAGLFNTRRDTLCNLYMSAQVAEKNYCLYDNKIINMMVRYIQEYPDLGLSYTKLDLESLRLKAFSNSAFANNYDNTWHLGFIFLLTDKFSQCNILNYSFGKSKQMTRSVLGGELHGQYVYHQV